MNKTIILIIVAGFILIGLVWMPNFTETEKASFGTASGTQTKEGFDVKKNITWIIATVQSLLGMVLLVKKVFKK